MLVEEASNPLRCGLQNRYEIVVWMSCWLSPRCRARGGRASGGQAKIVLEADIVLNTVLQADNETNPFLSAT
jgi:hypothetical protein